MHSIRATLAILLDNAAKFTSEGEIELGVESSGSGVHFWVRDTGIGVPEDKRETIFKPFERTDNSSIRRYGGAGLGLAIAQSLVEIMGGTLWVDSRPGAGSTFHVTLQDVEPH